MGLKYGVDKNFFKSWNVDMAYILGFIYADGSMEDSSYIRGRYVRITSTDLQIISDIKRSINSGHNLVRISSDLPNRKTRYLLRIGNKDIYSDLEKLGLYPNKSTTIRLPLIPNEFMPDFLRGYFDGDGGVSIEFSKGIHVDKILKRLVVSFTSGSCLFLTALSDALMAVIGYKKPVYNGHKAYQLRFSTKDSISFLNSCMSV